MDIPYPIMSMVVVRMNNGSMKGFIDTHFRHFNAGILREAAHAYKEFLEKKGLMFMAIAGAMSTAEIGKSLAEMIRKEKVHAICCTGANLEEDVFNLVSHNEYVRVPDYRDLSPKDEERLYQQHLNRVTDTCIPEDVMRTVEHLMLEVWRDCDTKGERLFPHEFFYKVLLDGSLKDHYQIDPKDCWVLAAASKGLPLFVPGWPDSTIGNMYTAECLKGSIKNPNTVKSAVEYLMAIVPWYKTNCADHPLGFFQIGGGITGDFAICTVPMMRFDLGIRDVPSWKYFCQISDSVTSYGSYSGAIPNEKITWGKMDIDTPRFMIESDATIVAPLIFAYVLDL